VSSNNDKFYIDGAWVNPAVPAVLDVIDPATERSFTQISMGSAADVDRAVAAAKRAFPAFSRATREQRLALLQKVLANYNSRYNEIAEAVTREMGAPLKFAREAQAWAGQVHLEATIKALQELEFSHQRGTTMIVREAIGVVGLITPWNWPLNQIVCKVAPALAAGCTMVLKPSEIAPVSGIIFAEIMHDAGVPPGVFNLVNGDGPTVGQYLAGHPDVAMMSFTGSTRAGIIVAKTAADTVKRVAQELGGKSANIILPDADLNDAVSRGAAACFSNSGQSCDAPTRMFVPANRHAEALEIAKAVAASHIVGDPHAAETVLGPVVSRVQFDKIQRLIQAGIEEGATLVAGGIGKPDGLTVGYYVRPTVFGNVKHEMTISREEIFGPVLAILPYDTEAEAIEKANDSVYGLAAYVSSTNLAHARAVTAELRAGTVNINYPDWDTHAPFGGYKQSGNGKEYADWGIYEFLETKGIVGYGA
jgi:aldehyde dehydrogenase (NAD+)